MHNYLLKKNLAINDFEKSNKNENFDFFKKVLILLLILRYLLESFWIRC